MYDCSVVSDLQTLSREKWEFLNYEDNPFLSYSFLAGLEKFDCLKSQYWYPSHIIIEKNNELIGALPLYIKQDSYGEFVFDWTWADAYQQSGRHYYPKLVSAIPFTPASGQRLLVNKKYEEDEIKKILLNAAISFMHENDFSSLHFLFPNKTDADLLIKNQGLKRLTCQYHWFNNDYRDFKDFLDTLTSKKRKKILRERREVKNTDITIQRITGKDISSKQWEVFYQFYSSTFYKKWGEPRLTLDFFKFIGEELAEQTVLILAEQKNEIIAGAFAMSDNDTLYGRHWGCNKEIPFLHFELCYYQTIEHAIENRLKRLDAGVQGEHKLARGFQPVAMSSAHWILEDDFRNAVTHFLNKETEMMLEYINTLKSHLPYKK